MMRFVPDDWLAGLLRPFVLIDPSSYVYFEQAAPDWRFAALFVALAIGLVTRRVPQQLARGQGRALLTLLLLLYLWTFTTGNGRYFAVGLLMVGPALVLAVRLLPGTLGFRSILLIGLATLQALTIHQVYRPNHWGLVAWREGPGLPVAASPLRQRPAVFLTIDTLSFSLLVPTFHPDSRWANIAGQRAITPAMWEYKRLQSLLASTLPIYVVVPENINLMTADQQPNAQLHHLVAGILAPHGLALTGAACASVPSMLKPQQSNPDIKMERVQGFWFCPAHASEAVRNLPAVPTAAPADLEELFAAVERRCPSFFPPGGGNTAHADTYSIRHYPGSDMRLFVEYQGRVLHKYLRAINPTSIGTLEQVRRGAFDLDCTNLPGRYRLPWQRD